MGRTRGWNGDLCALHLGRCLLTFSTSDYDELRALNWLKRQCEPRNKNKSKIINNIGRINRTTEENERYTRMTVYAWFKSKKTTGWVESNFGANVKMKSRPFATPPKKGCFRHTENVGGAQNTVQQHKRNEAILKAKWKYQMNEFAGNVYKSKLQIPSLSCRVSVKSLERKRFRWKKNQIGCYFCDGLPSNQRVSLSSSESTLHFFSPLFHSPCLALLQSLNNKWYRVWLHALGKLANVI